MAAKEVHPDGSGGSVDESPAQEAPVHARRPAFPVVGIGASAGGIEALKDFFAVMPADSDMAFVVIQHLEPLHDSRMVEILAKNTAMNVVQARDNMPLKPNTLFTNPPGRALSIRNGRFVLAMPPERRHVEAAIDHFLISLAEDMGERAIGIILSGSSAADGPQGVRAIRAAAGICMAQEPETAQFPAMPQGAIDTGLVDHVLPVGQMPARLLAYTEHMRTHPAGRDELPTDAASDDLESILRLLRIRTKSDYRHYKKATIIRRIRRRMGLRQMDNLADYLKLLQTDADELSQLSTDMLIGVSSFFRDPEVFDELRSQVILPLVEGKDADAPLRAWVPGCATGEEAYSVAMLLLEATAAAGKHCPVQVFASDVDGHALEVARAGVYVAGIADDVPADRLKRFFTKQGQTWQVEKRLREAVVFSRQNLLSDPPFSKLDLISCRNVLIYLEPAAQRKVLAMFSFALNVGGYLLLGKSEGTAGMEDLFEPVAKQKRIFRLTRSNRQAAGEFPLYGGGEPGRGSEAERVRPAGAALAQANQEAILRHFHASLVLVDAKGQIRYFHGQTEKYLGHPKGPATLNILDMTAGTLSVKLRRAIEQALQQDEPVVIPHATLPREGAPPANLTVMRLPAQADTGKILAILFEDVASPQPATSAPSAPPENEPLVNQLEAEVKALRGELRAKAEEYDSANEELKAGNEEVMSMNEELQSANEELEASKEELQSVNEELTTVNNQLAEKVTELTETNDDMANLLGSTHIATVFLDRQLRIRRFTHPATELLNLIPGDVGRPIGHITQNYAGEQLVADAENVLKSLLAVEREVQVRDGRWHTIRILPYRTLDDRIDGLVITFSEVTRLKQTESKLQYEKTYAESIVETVRDPLIVLDNNLRLLSVNSAFYRMFQLKPDQVIGKQIYDLGNQQWDIPRLRQLLEEILPKETAFEDFRVEHDFPAIGRRTMLLSARRIQATGEIPECILLTLEDVTEREQDREQLRLLNADLERRVTERTNLAERRAEQLQAMAVQLTQTEQRERHRLARALHDNLQQLLVAAKFQLRQVHADVKTAKARETVELLEGYLNQSLEASRSLIVELSPTLLLDVGLDAALPWLARQMKTRHGLDVETQIHAKVEQDQEGTVILLFQAVGELLFNVVKHANVNAACVQLDRIDENQVRIVVADKGVGFDPAKICPGQTPETGLGLIGFRERLEHLGGRCEIDSAPGRGTRITLVAPVRAKPKSA